jgi:hypothetical protein
MGYLHSTAMPSSTMNRMIGFASHRIPGLRRLPMLKLLALGEVLLLAQQHLAKLDRGERQRLVELIRIGRGRRRNLSLREQDELSELIARAEPRLFAASAAQKLSPVPIPGPVVKRLARK